MLLSMLCWDVDLDNLTALQTYMYEFASWL